jgi:hypothetical protein
VIAVLLVGECDGDERFHGVERIAGLLRHGTPECGGQVLRIPHQHGRALVAAFEVLDDPVHHPVAEAPHRIGGDRQYVGRQLVQRPRRVPINVLGSSHAASMARASASTCRPSTSRWSGIVSGGRNRTTLP